MKALATGFGGDVHMAQDAQATKNELKERKMKELESKLLDWVVSRAGKANFEFTSFVHANYVVCPHCQYSVPTFSRQEAECFRYGFFEP